MLPEIEHTVETMKEGEISDLVITPAGFHIIKLENRFTKNMKTFDEAKGEIEELLYGKSRRKNLTSGWPI